MKVLINLRDLDYKGGIVQIFKILKLNQTKNIDYFVFSKNKKFKSFFLLKSYFRFYYKIKEYDIVHLNPSLGKTALWRDLIFLLIAKLRKKKVIVFMHGWQDKYENKIKNSKFLHRQFKKYNKANAFFVLGDVFRQKLINLGISNNKKFYIETSIADDRYISDFNIQERINNFKNKDRIIKFLFISRITKGKGMKLAIDIFNKVQNSTNQKMQLIFAGVVINYKRQKTM